MKLKNFLLVLFTFSFLSVILNLLTNTQINILSSQLSNLNNEIIDLQIEKEVTYNLFQDKFSIKNIDELSKSFNFVRLDVYTINSNLIAPYKILETNNEVEVLGYFGKWSSTK